MNANKRRAIFETLQSLNPHPSTELEYTTPFELLIAVMLSAQATDVSVNKAMRKMFPVANTPQKIAALAKPASRSTSRQSACSGPRRKTSSRPARSCSPRFDGGKCPPAGKRSKACRASAARRRAWVLNTAFGSSGSSPSTRHIFRVANRTGLAPGKDVRAVEIALEKFTPEPFRHDAHHWLILHGRYVCKARRPRMLALRNRTAVRIPSEDTAARSVSPAARLKRHCGGRKMSPFRWPCWIAVIRLSLPALRCSIPAATKSDAFSPTPGASSAKARS